MMSRRALSHLEAALAISLALVLLPAWLPSPRHQLEAVRTTLEGETARLLLEAELSLAREAALRGTLTAGHAPGDPTRWRGAERLPELELTRQVEPDGTLWVVVVEASWRSPLSGPRRLKLETLAPRRQP